MSKTKTHPTVAVIGAGAFGGWTALQLLRKGCRVMLFDAWGPGHSRSSSGGETRIIRAVYGKDAIYSRWVARAFDLWQAFDERYHTGLLVRAPKLFFVSGDDDSYVHDAVPIVNGLGLSLHEYPLEEVRVNYPQVNLEGVRKAYIEERAGFLHARRACDEVRKAFVAEGGLYFQRSVQPGPVRVGRMVEVKTSEGLPVEADFYVFACGPWLPQLFPELLSPYLDVSRQEVYYFGTPPGSEAYAYPQMPIWLDLGERIFYGIPAADHRGFKVADDTRDGTIDPTEGDRTPLPERVARTRGFLQRRFPALKDAPLIEARVCQYTNSPDGHYLLDRHPEADNVWLAGAGCGHGFKMGPVLGEYLASLVLGEEEPLPDFSLERFENLKRVKSQFER